MRHEKKETKGYKNTNIAPVVCTADIEVAYIKTIHIKYKVGFTEIHSHIHYLNPFP